MSNWMERHPPRFVLARGEVVSLRLVGGPCRVSCIAGRLWVTASGDREDTMLAPGEEAVFTGRGRIVVEALRTATVRLETRPAERGHLPAPLTLEGAPAGARP
jgi:hypothetical protein